MTEPENLMHIEGAEDVRIAPAMGVAMIALNMALKYHDINTVQEGALYQQYRLEGKNMVGLHLDHVFETARHIERHLLTSSHEIAEMMVTGLLGALEGLGDEDNATPQEDAPEQSK